MLGLLIFLCATRKLHKILIRKRWQLHLTNRDNILYLLAFTTKLAFIALVLLTYSSGGVWARDKLTGLRLGEHPQKTRIVLDLSGRLPYSLFTLSDPYRVVIDLPELEWQASDRTAKNTAGLVTGYRFGLFQPGNSRFVLDLKEPAQVTNIFFLPTPAGTAPTRLVIDLVRTDRASFLKSTGFKSHPGTTVAVQQPAVKIPPPRAAVPPDTAQAAAGRMPVPNPRRLAVQELQQTQLPTPSTVAPLSDKTVLKRTRTVVIDAGHGGVDPGAMTASGEYEKHIVLDTAKRLQSLLNREPHYKVVMTRDSDVFVRLGDRVQMARSANADLFVSIHADALTTRKVRGASVYTLSESASDEEAALLAEKENNSDMIAGISIGDQTDEMVKNILIDLAQRETTNKSVHFAKLLLPELQNSGALLKNSHRYAGFRVLKAPDVPSVLIELGLLSNETDAKALTSGAGRQKLAAALKTAIEAYFRNFDT